MKRQFNFFKSMEHYDRNDFCEQKEFEGASEEICFNAAMKYAEETNLIFDDP